MTVNTTDIAAAESRAETICVRLDSIAENLDAVLPLIREAIAAEDHLTLGYKGISDYVQDRFGGALTRLPVDLRRPVVRELAQAGMSTRAIAPVVGVHKDTIRNDLARSGGEPSPPEPSQPAHVNTDTGEVLNQGAEPIPQRRIHHPEPRKTTGLDGKTYTRPEPKPRTEEDPEAKDRADYERALNELYTKMADHIAALALFGGYSDITELMAKWSPQRLSYPKQAETFEPDQLALVTRFMQMLTEWRKNTDG